MRFKNQVAIVTGGGSGLGLGICRSLAEEGADVVVSDVNLELAEQAAADLEETGQKILPIQTDVSKSSDCSKLMTETINKMGRIDILVCGAGVGGFAHRAPDSDDPLTIEYISEEDWDLTLDVNLKGVFLCNRAVAPYLKKQQSGKIINISSVGGRTGVDWIPHYSASKAGVIVLSQGVALQLAPYNINVNTVCPGYIWTPMWETGANILRKAYAPFKDKNLGPKELFNEVVEMAIPMKRPQTPKDIGNIVTFLASSDASEITGQSINVDGGSCFN